MAHRRQRCFPPALGAESADARTLSAKINGMSNGCDIDYQVPTVNARDAPANVASTPIVFVDGIPPTRPIGIRQHWRGNGELEARVRSDRPD